MGLKTAPFRALIIGSTGAIGSAFVNLLQSDPDCSAVVGIHRRSTPSIDYTNVSSIETAAQELASTGDFQLIINTTGVLHTDQWMPEKRLDDLDPEQIAYMMQVNAIGPALTIRYFSKLLDKQGAVMVHLSAKVGSIEDNRLGGWYSYRASKAALNMMLKTAAIELSRTKPEVVLIALHPGTVNSSLSRPFKGQQIGRSPSDAVADMWRVIKGLSKSDSGRFLSYTGEGLPW